MTIGENLRRLRRERGLHQEELARLARSSQQTISEIETGRRGAQTRTLAKLAGALHVPVGALFADDGGSTPAPPRPPRTPLTDEKTEDFDRRFAATDATSAVVLQAKVDKEFEALRQYVKQLEAAGVPDTEFKIKRARDRRREAQRRYYAIRTRANALEANADLGREVQEIHDTVEAYVGKAEEDDARHGEEAERSRAHPEAG